MTSELSVARAELAEVVSTTSAPGFAYIPERINPACWIVSPGSPFLEGGQTFGQKFKLRLVATFISAQAANVNVTTSVDEATEVALLSLLSAGYSIEDVLQPFAFQAGNAAFTAVSITVTTSLTI